MVNPDRNLYEPPYDDALLYDSDLEPERPRSRPLVVLLGIVVLAAFAGVVWVAYNQGVKQGSIGAPPILAADSGPTRIVPDAATDTQGANPAPDKSYERLWGEAPTTDGQENVLPQPEQPRTVPASPDIGPTSAAPTQDTSIGGPLETKATDLTPPSAAPAADPRMDSTVGIAGGSARPLATPSLAPPGTSEDITAQLPSETVVAPAAPKPITAPITPAKPTTVAKPSVIQTTPSAPPAQPPSLSKPATPAPVKATPPAPVEPQPTELATPSEPATPPAAASGSIMIQLGSFPSDALAASSWSKIKSANVDLLGSYTPSIKSANIPDKGTWYRLRVGGFADKASANEVCQQLIANGQACIVAAK